MNRSSHSLQALFVYGTLAPRDSEEAARIGATPDEVCGRLYDLGPYPALVDLDDPAAGWVEGFVVPVPLPLLIGPLDAYEGVAEGLYRRERTMTRRRTPAWVYVYARTPAADARGPLKRWDGPRAAPEVLSQLGMPRIRLRDP